jgi:hypothetical protein
MRMSRRWEKCMRRRKEKEKEDGACCFQEWI